jgi:type I restriction enzyme, S subunit
MAQSLWDWADGRTPQKNGSGMEVKPGYKQTEVGVIPEGWDVFAVRQMGEVITGKALAVQAPGKHRPYLRTKNVFDGRIDIEDVLTMPMTDEQFAHFQIRRGDVLLNEGQSLELVGRCSLYSDDYPEPCAIQNQLIRFRARDGVSPVFASYLFRRCQETGVFARIALQTTSIAHLGSSRFERLRLAWPKSEREQRAIAEALSDVDALLGGLDRLIAKKRDLKQAAMQQLLTGQTRLPGFHGKWNIRSFGDLFAFSGGYSASRDQLSREGHCYLHYGDIHGANKTWIDARADYQNIPKLDIPLKRVSSSSLLKDGDVVFVDASEDDEGTSKHIVVVNKENIPFIAGLHTIVAKSKTDELAHEYRRYCFQTAAIRQQFLFYAVGTKVSGISKTNIAKLTLPVPPVPEQLGIAEVLSCMDAELAALEQRREKTRSLKQAMMQELLTGKRRLT